MTAGAPPDAGSSSASVGIQPSCMEQELSVSLGAGNGRRHRIHSAPAKGSHTVRDFINCELVRRGIANLPALADVFPTCFKLGLDQYHSLLKRWRRRKHSPQQ